MYALSSVINSATKSSSSITHQQHQQQQQQQRSRSTYPSSSSLPSSFAPYPQLSQHWNLKNHRRSSPTRIYSHQNWISSSCSTLTPSSYPQPEREIFLNPSSSSSSSSSLLFPACLGSTSLSSSVPLPHSAQPCRHPKDSSFTQERCSHPDELAKSPKPGRRSRYRHRQQQQQQQERQKRQATTTTASTAQPLCNNSEKQQAGGEGDRSQLLLGTTHTVQESMPSSSSFLETYVTVEGPLGLCSTSPVPTEPKNRGRTDHPSVQTMDLSKSFSRRSSIGDHSQNNNVAAPDSVGVTFQDKNDDLNSCPGALLEKNQAVCPISTMTTTTVTKTTTMDPRSEMCLTALSVEHGSGWTDTTIDRLLEQTDPSSSSTTSIASTASASTSSTSSTSSIVTITTAPLTPRSQRPKPSPITTRSLKRAGSLPLSSNNTSLLSRNSEGPPSNTRLDHRQLSEQTEPGQEDTAPETNADAFGSGDEDGRDSGIALEKWDGPQRLQLETGIEAACCIDTTVTAPATEKDTQEPRTIKTTTTEKKDKAFPTFSQLLYFTPDSFDQGYPVESRAPGQEQQQQQSGGNRRRRERCRSMMHPSTPRAVDNDDLDIWSRSDVEVELHSLESKRDSSRRHGRASDTKVDSGTVDAAGKRKTRQKRVSSMVFGSDLRSQLNSTANGLPPLPLFQTQQQQIQQQQRTAATTVEAPLPSSFFHSPSPQEKEATSRSGKDKGRDSSYHSHRTRTSTYSSNSFSSSASFSSSTTSATLNLSRPTSPIGHQHQQLSGFGPSIPFSNLLDLATAKAENITGLYFARQLNVSATQLQDEPRQESATTNVGKEHSSLLDGPLSPSTMASSITININAASPAPAPASSDSEPLTLGSGLTATQNALHSGLAVERTVSTLPPLPNFNATGRPAPRRSRAVTSSGNTSSCSLSSFSFPPTTPPKDPRTENTSRSSLTSTPTNGTGSGMLSSPGTHRRSHSASHFFHLSSLKRHSPAQFNLALCYEHGQGGVEQDLAKALYFYQQAADQGHTKASYNIGCLCYNEGEIRKAIAWFEGAGKCRIRGLHPMDVSTATPLSSSSRIECPMPRQDLLFPHELEDLLRGESTTNDDSCASGGPFTVYLPAILCLALLCRQGIKDPKDGSVILKSDPVQAAELLQRLVQKAPAALTTSWDELSETKGESSRPCTRLNGRQRQASSSGALSSARTLLDKETTSVLPTDDGTGRATSQFSSSCPALSTMNQVKPLDCSFSTAASLSKRTRNKRSSFVEDAVDDDDVDLKKPFQQPQSYVPLPPRPSTPSTIPPPGTADAHESWAVQLAQRLLKIWRSDTERQQNPVKKMTKKSTTVVADQDQKILRYHLLYITNPTLTKNLYNLGVLYDLLLNDRPMAIKCYTFAFQNSHSSLSPTTSQRINCAWNMGVLYSKAQEWPLARDWFLRSQEDIRLLEINEKKSTAMTRGLFCNSVMTKDKSKSPSMRQARKHGLWIHPPPSSPSLADSSLMSSTPKEEDVVLATDSDKVALVLRWIDSKLH